jgi:hypothetical protein
MFHMEDVVGQSRVSRKGKAPPEPADPCLLLSAFCLLAH